MRIEPLVAETQAGIHEVAADIETGTEPVITESRSHLKRLVPRLG